MFGPKFLQAVASVVITLATALVILLINLYLLASPAFIRFEYDKLPAVSGFTQAERLDQALSSLAYLRSSQGIQALQALEHRGAPLYNTRELVHMADVKVVMSYAFAVFWGALALWIVAAIYVLAMQDLRPKLPVYVFRGALLLVLLLAAIGAMALLSFTDFFFLFHRVFFVGDSWLFPATDNLIRLFPESFWVDAAFGWVLLALLEAVVVGAAAYLWPGWRHGRSAAR